MNFKKMKRISNWLHINENPDDLFDSRSLSVTLISKRNEKLVEWDRFLENSHLVG